QVGNARFHFLLDEVDPAAGADPASPIRLDDTTELPVATEVLRLHPQLSAYQYAPLHGDSAYLERLARDMNAILRLNGDVSSISTTAELQEVLLKRTFERIPSETGVILLGHDVDELVAAARTAQFLRVSEKPPYVSRMI